MDPLAARPNGVEALEELRDALDEQEQRGERDDELERPDDRAPGARVRGLPDLERVIGLLPAEVEEEDHRREEEEEVADRVDPVLAADGPARIEHVGAHVPDPHEGVGGAQHEVRAVQHVDHVEGPDGGGAEEVAGHDLPGDGDGHRDDEPRGGPARRSSRSGRSPRSWSGRPAPRRGGRALPAQPSPHGSSVLFAGVERRAQGRVDPWVGGAVRRTPGRRGRAPARRPGSQPHRPATSARSCPCSSARR